MNARTMPSPVSLDRTLPREEISLANQKTGVWSLELIQNEDDFMALAPWWDALLERSCSPSPFLRWAWVSTWWSIMRTRFKLAIGVVRNTSGEPEAIAPLVLGSFHRGPRRALRHLGFMGGLGEVDSPRLDFMVQAGHEPFLMPRLCRIFAKLRGQWDCIRLNGVPAESPTVPYLRKALKKCGFGSGVLNNHDSRYIKLPATWQDYEMTHSGSWRSKIRRKWKALEREHAGSSVLGGKDTPVESAMEEFIDLHRQHFPEGVSDFLSGDSGRFHREIARQWLPSGRALMPTIQIEGKAAGAIYGFLEGDSFYQYQMGWDTRFQEISMGQLSMAWCLRAAMAERVQCYDVLPGEYAYKESWCPEVRHLLDLESYRPLGFRSNLFLLMRTLKRLSARRASTQTTTTPTSDS